MKADFNRAALAEALGLVGSVVPSRTPKPILRCVHISCEKEAASIRATDLEAGIALGVDQVKVIRDGQILVPADSISAIVRESADEVLGLEAEEGTCHVSGSDSSFTIYGQDPAQYPPVPGFDGEPDLKVQLGDLQLGIAQCLFAAARESTRYAINGVLWQLKGKKLVLVATDGRRLARSRVPVERGGGGFSAELGVIVPSKAMALLEKIGAADDEEVQVRLCDNRILLRCGSVVLSSSLVEGNFPKYEDIIPSDYECKLNLSTEATLSAVRRAALLTSAESRGIRLSLSSGDLVFSGKAPEAGDARVTMPVEYGGDPIEIGFGPQFLVDVLRVIKADQLTLELGQADRPGLIKSGSDFLYVLMPINIG
jgi:DNA polymerase-3 subunit beta